MTILTVSQGIWTLIKTFMSDYYNENNIFMSYQNNYTMPQSDSFIVITQLNVSQIALPNNIFDHINQKEIFYAHGDWEYQVDLYGQNSDVAASMLQTYLNSFAASDYLLNLNSTAIGKLQNVKNLTRQNDRDRWMKRYTLIFTVLNTSSVSVSTTGLIENDIHVILQEQT